MKCNFLWWGDAVSLSNTHFSFTSASYIPRNLPLALVSNYIIKVFPSKLAVGKGVEIIREWERKYSISISLYLLLGSSQRPLLADLAWPTTSNCFFILAVPMDTSTTQLYLQPVVVKTVHSTPSNPSLI